MTMTELFPLITREIEDQRILMGRIRAAGRTELQKMSTKTISQEELQRAVDKWCTCGGYAKGERLACPACNVWHELKPESVCPIIERTVAAEKAGLPMPWEYKLFKLIREKNVADLTEAEISDIVDIVKRMLASEPAKPTWKCATCGRSGLGGAGCYGGKCDLKYEEPAKSEASRDNIRPLALSVGALAGAHERGRSTILALEQQLRGADIEVKDLRQKLEAQAQEIIRLRTSIDSLRGLYDSL